MAEALIGAYSVETTEVILRHLKDGIVLGELHI